MDNQINLVSVVIPVFNADNYLKATLDSIVQQSYKNLEIIIVDDCSQDNSCLIAERFCNKYSNCRLVKLKKNVGQSCARNVALKQANGDYVYFMDSDDILPKDAISTLVKEILIDNYDFVIGEVRTIGGDTNKLLYSTYCYEPEIYNNNIDIVRRFTRIGWCVAPWAKLFNKQFLLDNDIFFKEGIIHEDELFSFTYVYYAQKVKIIPVVVYDYYIRVNSTMTQKISERHLDGIKSDIEGMKYLLFQKYNTPLVTRIIILAYRLVEVILQNNFNIEIKRKYFKILSDEITTLIIIHSFKYGIKVSVKAIMFLLPSALWPFYINLLGRR